MTDAVLALLRCPRCRSVLARHPDGLRCVEEGLVYPVLDGVPILLPERAKPAPSTA